MNRETNIQKYLRSGKSLFELRNDDLMLRVKEQLTENNIKYLSMWYTNSLNIISNHPNIDKYQITISPTNPGRFELGIWIYDYVCDIYIQKGYTLFNINIDLDDIDELNPSFVTIFKSFDNIDYLINNINEFKIVNIKGKK